MRVFRAGMSSSTYFKGLNVLPSVHGTATIERQAMYAWMYLIPPKVRPSVHQLCGRWTGPTSPRPSGICGKGGPLTAIDDASGRPRRLAAPGLPSELDELALSRQSCPCARARGGKPRPSASRCPRRGPRPSRLKLVQRDGQVAHAPAGGVIDRVGDGRGDADDADLAHALDTERIDDGVRLV